ncbi:MAG: anacyclamide/piricyclamide family prenylated cyclic peptide [Moorea sp. SIO3G5]|nr:anacyclamide/piricyclamide family prenylated cyclic peptide [Moorena sp. SIO3G5]
MPKKKLTPKQTAPVSRNGVASSQEQSPSVESLSQYSAASCIGCEVCGGFPFAGDDAE